MCSYRVEISYSGRLDSEVYIPDKIPEKTMNEAEDTTELSSLCALLHESVVQLETVHVHII
jgi:hypothetical protein